MLTGHPDARINTNEYGPNPNVSVYEWLNQAPDLHGRVAAFASWHAFKDIFNEPRSQLVLQAGSTRLAGTVPARVRRYSISSTNKQASSNPGMSGTRSCRSRSSIT